MTTQTEKARAIEARVKDLLKAEFGDQVRMGGGAVSESQVTLKIVLQLATGEAQTVNLRKEFEAIARCHGLLGSDFDLPLVSNGKPVFLMRVERGRAKYPFVVKVPADGRMLKVTADIFLAARARASGTAA